jgi:uncharacterized protein (DUF1810 family)
MRIKFVDCALIGSKEVTRDLQHFMEAQALVYDQVHRELRDGEKRSHWMWFIFPQLAGLGHSAMAHKYAIVDKAHARAYLENPVLGGRLRECVRLVIGHRNLTAEQMFGYPDYLKLHSSLTLFHEAAPRELLFAQALRQLYAAQPDQATLTLLQDQPK